MAVSYGGQAVLEGVMMRGPSNWSVAVRKPDGDIAHVSRAHRLADEAPRARASARHPRHRRARRVARDRLPRARHLRELRGAGGERPRTTRCRRSSRAAQLIFAFAVAIGFAIALFKVTPALITDLLPISNTTGFVVVEGLIRVSIFILYLSLISLLPDLRRVFQYHAAEHKAINALEAGDELVPERVQRYSLHPPALRHGVPALGDGDRDLRLRVLRPARVVLADRDAHPAAAGDRRDRVRADPLRRQAHATTAS